MENKRKEVTKLFDENPNIESGWLDLDINNGDVVIGVSYAYNEDFFYSLLNILTCVADTSIGLEKLYLDMDLEGAITRISFQTCLPRGYIESDKKDEVEREYLNIDIIPDLFHVDILDNKSFYKISIRDFVKNCFNLIEKNIDRYNKDFLLHGYINHRYFKKEYLEIIKNFNPSYLINPSFYKL